MSLFLLFLKARIRHFVKEIFSYHWKLCFGLMFLYGFLVSGNEQAAIKMNFASLYSSTEISQTLMYQGLCWFVFSFILSLQVKTEVLGGSASVWLASNPIPLHYRRWTQFFLLTIMNLPIIATVLMSLEFIGLHESGSYGLAIFEFIYMFSFFYIGMIVSQISWLVRRRLWALGLAGIWLLSLLFKDQYIYYLASGLQLALIALFIKSSSLKSSRSIPKNAWFPQLRLKNFLKVSSPQILLLINKPGLLYSRMFFIMLIYLLVYLTVSVIELTSQKIYVYSVLTGLAAFVFAGYMNHFFNSRRSSKLWLRSMPQDSNHWFCQDWIITSIGFLFIHGLVGILLISLGYLNVAIVLYQALIQMMMLKALQWILRPSYESWLLVVILGLSVVWILIAWLFILVWS
ncbi:MAG: hypothetical protein HRU19_08595 [Pseudobacteriovorax sp.]|nr:hypothetical protein [Pseudobacteriovorax sp.]